MLLLFNRRENTKWVEPGLVHDICYSADAINVWKESYYPLAFNSLLREVQLPRRFYDIWRVLHVDGFGIRKLFFYGAE